MNNEQHEWYWKGYNDAKKSLAQPAVAEQHKQEPFDGCVIVVYSKDDCAYFVYEETAPNEFRAIKGPFVTLFDAKNAMRDPNAPLIEQPKEPEQRSDSEQQEPVAVYVSETWCGSVVRLYEDLPLETPLYTTPPQRTWVGLTYDELIEIIDSFDYRYDVAKAVEAKLKEKNT